MKNTKYNDTLSPTNRRAPPQRFPFIDALKAIASQLIVLHHLAFYGPMSDYAQDVAPELFGWFAQHARIAVQVFLVIGGFLAAQSLTAKKKTADTSIGRLLWSRYLKLAVPYILALCLALFAAAISRKLMDHDSIPDVPTLAQLLAHIVLLQGIFGFDGLSAGVWYIAIDFQLYFLLLIVVRAGQCATPGRMVSTYGGVVLLLLASLYWHNRDAELDDWAIYFFGAYGLGAIAHWGTQNMRIRGWALATVVVAAGALFVDFRIRILVAIMTAIALGFARCSGAIANWPKSQLFAWLGRISYSVFLTHFPVCLLVNAVFERYFPHTADIQLCGILLAWTGSIASGQLLYAQVECRMAKSSGKGFSVHSEHGLLTKFGQGLR